ncbi:hypothetical protein [Azospirillum doebereinerae]|uniref:DUF2147 domain-containing protein n=1 Tax=Azospirillum doebereinerae TaxID=92933 RepID=A0A3S0VH94_9PROT|nr:hypothetical protein [Azospirillum doebereinerae]MCG5238868.1 hypothetical protein [Azospirillum doebereinerae]RUQ68883.1 hypothetical protein EJ913_17065 [Azospirillum doebereinerae]
MTRIAAAFLLAALLAAGSATAEPMKGSYELRCQDPATRQWSVSGRITDPDIRDKPAGGREVVGKGPDGKPMVLPMPNDRTCMLSQS